MPSQVSVYLPFTWSGFNQVSVRPAVSQVTWLNLAWLTVASTIDYFLLLPQLSSEPEDCRYSAHRPVVALFPTKSFETSNESSISSSDATVHRKLPDSAKWSSPGLFSGLTVLVALIQVSLFRSHSFKSQCFWSYRFWTHRFLECYLQSKSDGAALSFETI